MLSFLNISLKEKKILLKLLFKNLPQIDSFQQHVFYSTGMHKMNQNSIKVMQAEQSLAEFILQNSHQTEK